MTGVICLGMRVNATVLAAEAGEFHDDCSYRRGTTRFVQPLGSDRWRDCDRTEPVADAVTDGVIAERPTPSNTAGSGC